MYCSDCNSFFQPTPDEERLMVTGAIPSRCIACETRRWSETAAQQELVPLPFPGTNRYRGDGTQLYRAEWFGPKGESLLFVALPLIPIKQTNLSIKPNKMGRLHVMIMGDPDSRRQRTTTQPQTILHTNLPQFQGREDNKLWIRKIPGFVDAQTGADCIEVGREIVEVIEVAERLVTVKTKGKGEILMKYR